jgi:hypothetical protein
MCYRVIETMRFFIICIIKNNEQYEFFEEKSLYSEVCIKKFEDGFCLRHVSDDFFEGLD